ncbi:unnamed protein product [Clonostachys rosea]|uniref:Glycoside hydrolase family 43 protein n=1 Tax=Bionectria ochroleuca TaxID=29856 RepID=A0ABY6TX30_BIOOC|nr:unnamed protein product [Clonostachys rosea]
MSGSPSSPQNLGPRQTMLNMSLGKPLLVLAGLGINLAHSQDTLGLGNGYLNFSTRNFDFDLVHDAQTLASLRPSGSSFDFLPSDYLSFRARNGQYHWGDITVRYRQSNDSQWTSIDSSLSRQPVVSMTTASLASSELSQTIPESPLNITRDWIDHDGDVALRFTLHNTASAAVELGAVGFPTEFNSIFTNRTASDIQRMCSLADPYIGLDAGYIRVAPISGTGQALVVTPLEGTRLEAYRNLREVQYSDLWYGSQVFEGLYEWTVLTQAWAENEWAANGTEPWNPPSSRTLQPNEEIQFGVRFSVAHDIRGIEAAVRDTGAPVAVGAPGYIIPQSEPARLWLQANSQVSTISVAPASAVTWERLSESEYTITPAASAWGRVRLAITYEDGKTQTVHYYITKPGTDAVGDLGRFLTTESWFNDTRDPFGRAPSPLTYDNELGSLVTQDPRAWVAGLSDEAGAGTYISAFVKQAVQPNGDEITLLESFVDQVLWKTIQTSDYGVRKSIFYYEPAIVPDYPYSPAINWTTWTSWNEAVAYDIGRAYNYVHVVAAYWSFYRVGRAYPDLLTSHAWDWYLDQAYNTIMRCMQTDIAYNRVGLMGETVFGEVLADLEREGQASKFESLKEAMQSRSSQWDSEEVPYGSEMAWDSTGQEGVYFWTKYFGYNNTVTKTVNSVLGYTPTVPHWGWNGNSRRYWDNVYGGKLKRIERQIHHYGSALNSLVLLSAFRSNVSDTYILRTGYGGISGPLSSIHQNGFAAASFHSWPDTLKWDGISGDYGPGFLGLALGSGTYIGRDADLGIVAFGGVLETGSAVRVRTTDPVRRRVFLGELGLLLTVDSNIIETIRYDVANGVEIVLGHLPGVPRAGSTILWVESEQSDTNYTVVTDGIQEARGGWKIPMDANMTTTITLKSS